MTNLYIDFDGVIVNSIDVTYKMLDESVKFLKKVSPLMIAGSVLAK